MDTFASPPVDLRAFGVCPRCRSVSPGYVVIGGAAWLLCDRHQLRWLFDGDPACLANERSGGERGYDRVTPVWLASFHPANQRVEQLRAAVRPRILASSAARRRREARAECRQRSPGFQKPR